MYSDDTALLAHLQALETELHLPATRRDAARLDALLHGDFGEIGRSGVAYTKADVLAQLSLEAAHADIVAGGSEAAGGGGRARCSPTARRIGRRTGCCSG